MTIIIEIGVAPSNDRKQCLIDGDFMIRTTPSDNKKHDKSPSEHGNDIKLNGTLPNAELKSTKVETINNSFEKETTSSHTEKTSKHIVNLLSTQIDQITLGLLERGLNFSISPRTIPKEDILCNIEYRIKDLPDNIKEIVRQDCSIIIRRARPPKRNISKQEYLALKTLNQNPNIVILKADKGGVIVIMNKKDYDKNMLDHLNNNGCYTILKKNPIGKVSKIIKGLIKASNEHNTKNLIETNPYTPRIYGAPKIHKEGVPIRPIVNTICGPTYHLAKYLPKKLKPLVGNTSSFIKDPNHFINEIKHIKLDQNDILVSFDMKSLYTNIPIGEAMKAIHKIIDPNTAKLVEVCLRSTFSSYKDDIYEQTCSVAMGSPLSPIIANLFMEVFKTKAIEFSPLKPKIWKRVDNTYII